jgi:hypothetical protein
MDSKTDLSSQDTSFRVAAQELPSFSYAYEEALITGDSIECLERKNLLRRLEEEIWTGL